MHFPKYIDDSAVSSYRMTLTISYAGKPWKKGSSWRSSNVKVILEDGTAETSMLQRSSTSMHDTVDTTGWLNRMMQQQRAWKQSP